MHTLQQLQRTLLIAALVAAASVPNLARADDHEHMAASKPLPEYQQECGACHLAYPAGMLPAASWQHLLSTLPEHFGTDASLDAEVRTRLTAWLSAHAGTGRRGSEAPPEDRISRSRWFLREHGELRASTWQLPAVKSASNCGACHRGAERGDFSEDSVRVPR